MLKEERDFPGGAVDKNLCASAGDTGSIPDLGRFPHAEKQLSPCAETTEAQRPRLCSATRESVHHSKSICYAALQQEASYFCFLFYFE